MIEKDAETVHNMVRFSDGRFSVKKLFLALFLFAITAPCLMSCATDTHYDSVSTEIELKWNVYQKAMQEGAKITLPQRFEFGRDLGTVSTMTLHEAWLVAPSVSVKQREEQANRLSEDVFTLDFVKKITISLVDANKKTTEWLTIPESRLHGNEAVFEEINVGDLHNYITFVKNSLGEDIPTLEIAIDIAVEPYHAVRYWSDVCNMVDTSEDPCSVHLPLSMQFKMVE